MPGPADLLRVFILVTMGLAISLYRHHKSNGLVFMFIEIFLDVGTPGGPTSEALISRKTKLVTALQTLLAIVMLTVS